jgi:type IV secretory pathway VirJ component
MAVRPPLSRLFLLVSLLGVAACAPLRAQPRPPLAEAVKDLPLRVLPAPSPSPVLALVMSGDGNWAHFIADMADALVARGIPVVGLESRAYLSRPRTPKELTQDMERVLRTYLDVWGANRVLIVGYSRGADFAPFLVNRLPADLRARILGVGLFSPTKMASFEFHYIDLVTFKARDTDMDAVPEVEALAPLPVLCVYGTQDKDTLCPLLPEGMATVVPRDAGHRLHEPDELADLLLDATLGAWATAPGASPRARSRSPGG